MLNKYQTLEYRKGLAESPDVIGNNLLLRHRLTDRSQRAPRLSSKPEDNVVLADQRESNL